MSEESVTNWIAGVGAKDPDSEQALWNHYFKQVVRLARSRMQALQSAIYDEEDAAASALRSLFRGITAATSERIRLGAQTGIARIRV